MKNSGQEKGWKTVTEPEQFGAESLEAVFFAKQAGGICLTAKY